MNKAGAVKFDPKRRDLWGGDWGVLRTIPKVHPKYGFPLATTREGISNIEYCTTLMLRGDVVYLPDPGLEQQILWWDDDGGLSSRRVYTLATLHKGFEVAKAKEWDIRPELQKLITKEGGQVVIVTSKDSRMVMMVRSKERMEFEEEKDRRYLQRINKDMTERVAAVANQIQGVETLPVEEEVEHVMTGIRRGALSGDNEK